MIPMTSRPEGGLPAGLLSIVEQRTQTVRSRRLCVTHVGIAYQPYFLHSRGDKV